MNREPGLDRAKKDKPKRATTVKSDKKIATQISGGNETTHVIEQYAPTRKGSRQLD